MQKASKPTRTHNDLNCLNTPVYELSMGRLETPGYARWTVSHEERVQFECSAFSVYVYVRDIVSMLKSMSLGAYTCAINSTATAFLAVGSRSSESNQFAGLGFCE